MKQCSKCQQNKNFDQFYKSSSSKDGYYAYCKECYNEYRRGKRGSKRKYNRRGFISETHKQCTRCREIKTFNEFAKNKGNSSGIHSWCKQCMSDNALESRGGRVFKKIKIDSTHKECRMCGEMKPHAEYASKNGSKPKETYCTECKKFMGTERVLKRYGLDVDSYIKIFNEQGGICKICKNPEKDGKRLAVDHDHSCCSGASSCGKCIRGLLCSRCNRTLGMVEDNTDYLNAMIEYLS